MIDFLSEDYIDFTIRYSADSRRFLQENPNIILCKVLEGRFAVVYVHISDLPEFLNAAGTLRAPVYPTVQGLMGRIDMEVSGILAVQNQPYLSLYGQGVLLGFVDTGIDYTLDTFRYGDGSTRIVSLWDQSVQGNAPEDFCFGAEYSREDINMALRSEDPQSIVPHRDDAGHGTFLASVAGGRESDSNIGAAPYSELVVVKLKKLKNFFRNEFLIPENQQNAYSSSDIMMGLDYLVHKAAELKRPIAICVCLGSSYTGHDGYSYYQEYISGLSMQTGVFITAAAGNESNTRHHMTGYTAQGESADIEIRVGEKEQGFVLTLWTFALDRMSVSLTSPLGETISRIPAQPELVKVTNLLLENTTVTVEYHFPLATTGSQLTIIKLRKPTPGIWSITVYGDLILNGQFHAWLPITGFVGPDTAFLSPSPYYTVTSPGTAFGVTTCGAYSSINQSLYVSSSWGPSRFDAQLPDLVAPGVNVMGVYPWGYGTMTGTSVSAAITAGAGALLLQWGSENNMKLNSINIRTYLLNGCTRRPGFTYPNYQWGFGELNLIRAFEIMRQI